MEGQEPAVDDAMAARPTLPPGHDGPKEWARRQAGRARHAWRGRGLSVAHYIHVGKTGGSAVKRALKPVATAGTYRLDLHGHGFTLDDMKPGQKFLFGTRDPLTRFVSGFYSRRRGGAPPNSRAPWSPEEAVAFRGFETPNDLAERIDDDPAARAAMHAIIHVQSPYSSWFGSFDQLHARRADLLAILRQEHLDADFTAMLPRLGLEGRAALPTDEAGAHRGQKGVDRTLSPRAEANLRAWYAEDYDFLARCDDLAAELWG